MRSGLKTRFSEVVIEFYFPDRERHQVHYKDASATKVFPKAFNVAESTHEKFVSRPYVTKFIDSTLSTLDKEMEMVVIFRAAITTKHASEQCHE